MIVWTICPNYVCPFFTSSSHWATVFPEACAQKWTPRNWLWPNSLVFGWPHFWQIKCSGVRLIFGVRPCALAAAAASSAFLRRQAVVLGTFGLGGPVAGALCSGSVWKGSGPPITTLITSPTCPCRKGSGTLCCTGNRGSDAFMLSVHWCKTNCSCFLALYLCTENMIQYLISM